MNNLTKFSRALLAIAMMLCVALPTLAHDFEKGGIYYKITNSTNKTVAVTYKGSSDGSYSNEYTRAVSIPSSVTYNSTTYSVTSIGGGAFEGCSGLTSVTIPNSVTSIGKSAFYNCTGLTSVTIGNSVTSIGNSAFSYCSGLTSVTIPNSVTSIGYRAFYDCSGLTEVTLGNSVTSIGNSAFYNCSGLTEVTIPNSVTSIDSYAFYRCTGLTSVTIGNSVTSIGDEAFRGCSGLTEVTIPNSVTSIGESVFWGCTGLTEVNYNAENCTSMGSSSYPVFRGCSLKTLNIGNEVKTVPNYAFKRCSSKVVTSYCKIPPACNYAFENYSALLQVPEGTKEAYANATGWRNFTNVQEIAGVEDIEADNNAVEVSRYDIHGRLLSEPTPGINIVKMSNGTTRKEIVK